MKNKFLSLRNIIDLVLLIGLSCVAIYLAISDETPKKYIPQEQEIEQVKPEESKERTIEEDEELVKTSSTGFKFGLATEYFRSDSIERHKKAFEWFTELNNEKVRCANVALGVMYYEGKGVEKDTKKAFKLWEKDECSEDFPESMFTGIAYEHWFKYLKDTKQAQKLYEEGKKCLDRKCTHRHWESCQDCIPAFDYFTAASDLGHIKAKYELGAMHYWEGNQCCGYCIGEGDDFRSGIDSQKAFDFFMQAAKGGSIKAMRDLGYMYLYDDNPDGKDASEAEKWFLKAANAGDKRSIMELTRIYFNGFGVDENMEKAKYFAEKAIQQGKPQANYYLGMLYYEGKYLKQDYKKALKLFGKTLEYPYRSDEVDLAKDTLYKMYMAGQGTTKNEDKAKEYGNENYYFSKPYAMGREGTREVIKQEKEKASKGEVKYQLILANKYYEGVIAVGFCTGCKETLVAKDYKKAFYWYQKAFKQDSSEAATKLGEMYEQGKYVKQDINKAKEYYEKAEILKFMEKQSAEMKDIVNIPYKEREDYVYTYFRKEITNKELEKALYYLSYNFYELRKEDIKKINELKDIDYKKYEELANKGDSFAQLVVADRYYKGIGVKQDFAKAFEYFSKSSATQRCAESALGNMYFKGEGVEKDTQRAIDLWTKNLYTEEYLDDPEDDTKEDCSLAALKYPNLMSYPVETYVLFEELAKQGNPEIQTKLGELYSSLDSGLLSYELNWDNDVGYDRAEFWFNKAIKQNYRDAYAGMAELKSGTTYADKAFEMGSIRAYNQLGDENFYAPHVFSGHITRIYDRIGKEEGDFGVIFDWALKYYTKTADKGDPYGLYHTGLMYDKGYGVEKDPKKAMEYYQKAIANIDFVSDMRPKRMGKMYQQFGERLLELGKTKEAKIVLNKSIELGNTKSKEILKKIKI